MEAHLYYLIGVPVGATAGIIGCHIGYNICCRYPYAKQYAHLAVILLTLVCALLFCAAAAIPSLSDLPADPVVLRTVAIGAFYLTAAVDFLCLAIMYGVQKRDQDFSPRNFNRELQRRAREENR